MRTLVVHTGGIGDLLLALPSVVLLARDGPVEMAGRGERLALALDAGLIARAYDLDAVRFETVFTEPGTTLSGFLARFDRVIVWMRDDGAIERALRACGPRDVRVFPGIPPEDWPRHASEYYAARLGFDDTPAVRLDLGAPLTGHDVVIHPGSGAARKNWPADRYVALTQKLIREGWGVTWCLGPAEERVCVPRGVRLLQEDSLVALGRMLAGARLYIGNDSGVAHLAAAVGRPAVVIFGPTNPYVWAPLGDSVRPVRGEPWPSADAVFEAARRMRR